MGSGASFRIRQKPGTFQRAGTKSKASGFSWVWTPALPLVGFVFPGKCLGISIHVPCSPCWQAKGQFKKQSVANGVEISVPVPSDADSPRFKTSVGSAKYVPEKNVVIWSIKSFPVSTVGRGMCVCVCV